jgi:hypothetical protein
MKILFYGNCQLFAILHTLNFEKDISATNVECFNTTLSEAEFTNLIITSDVIISQPISDNYRDKHYLSTSYILDNKMPECKLILFDSCYFNFYYFDLSYKLFNNEMLAIPIHYHYNEMINCYLNNKSVDYYIEHFVNNIELKSCEELENNAINSLNDLYNRYIINTKKYNRNNVYIISTYDYIKENYKNKLLFYSMNHPTKYVIQYICEEIINILQIKNTINYEKDILSNPKCILYKCLKKVVNFDIEEYNVLTSNLSSVENITQLYYDTYTKIGYKI